MGEASLYERDVVLWSEQQAALLRAAAASRRNEAIDWENVAEEIESLGKSQAAEVRSRLGRIVEHLLKLQFSPADTPRQGWIDTIIEQRGEIELQFADSPSLEGRAESLLAAIRPLATKRAANSLRGHGEQAAGESAVRHGGAYSLEQVMGEWFP